MLQTKNGVQGKVCSTCHQWKPLGEFSTDPTHPPTQGGRHCRCRECHRKAAAIRRVKSGAINVALVVVAMILVLTGSYASSKDKSRIYQTGRLLDLEVQDVNRGTAIIGGMAAPIRGKLYIFQIQSDGLVYFAEYRAGKLSYKPDWVVNDPILFRLEKDNKMFLKRSDDKELEVGVVKRVRPE
jgi:hypothetical protein